MDSFYNVKFRLLKSVTSPRIKRTITLRMVTSSTEKSTLGAASHVLGAYPLYFVDKKGRRKSFGSPPWPSELYVTKYPFYDPSGKASQFAYLYRDTDEGIKAKDIVSVSGQDPERQFIVLKGIGVFFANPRILVRSLDGEIEGIVRARQLTLIRRYGETSAANDDDTVPLCEDCASIQ